MDCRFDQMPLSDRLPNHGTGSVSSGGSGFSLFIPFQGAFGHFAMVIWPWALQLLSFSRKGDPRTLKGTRMTNDEQEDCRVTATRNSWYTKPLPKSYSRLQPDRAFTADKYEQLSYGLIHSHWFIYLDLEKHVLYFHQTWTRFCFCEVHLEQDANGFRTAEVLVNRDRDQYGGTDDKYDLVLIFCLIDTFLLKKKVPFPIAR
jgi:hypothetical protein